MQVRHSLVVDVLGGGRALNLRLAQIGNELKKIEPIV